MGLFSKAKPQKTELDPEEKDPIVVTEAKDTNTSDKAESKNKKPLADPAYTWGITPTAEHMRTEDPYQDKNHPVHKIPLEKQEKMRKKRIDPVAKAEMDEALKGEGGFWAKFAGTSMGGGYIK